MTSTSNPPSAVPVSDYDPFTAEALADPIRYDGELREYASIVHLAKYDVYAVTRQSELRQVGRDRKKFSSRSRAFADPSPFKPPLMLMQDPPEHTAIKKLALELFSKENLRTLDETFHEEAERLVAGLLTADSVELDAVESIGTKFITKVFLDALGAPEEGRELLKHFADAALNSTAPKNDLYYRKHAIGAPALEWVERNTKRETAGEHGWGKQIYTMVDEGRLSEEDGEQLVKLIFAAGFDTTVGSIVNSIRAFADNPEQWALLKANPDLLGNAIEEVLRYYPPVRYTGRVAAAESEVDGHLVPEGAPMMMMWLSGGRDPRFWENPDVFDIRRENVAGHMTFGVGIHACLGQHIARMETRAVLTAMLAHVDSLESAGVPEVSDNMQGFGFTKVPVRLFAAGKH
ncbi:cytochrome P450 [Amycolatopsis echigonensis]|uniref:Cytochrome P450 n=1 Tax=Amycolatopsis echigonensis TaxID=2576905 RepID=A0A8E1W6E0_9PSEU|nr:cytochrome P450 [Amycolatopsis echigonensis]MBB2504410.1 cytochrome P450 [Amycolatopsis echigonensis]